MKNVVIIAPNPSAGLVAVSVISRTETLNNISVINLFGQQVATIKGQNKDYYLLRVEASDTAYN